MLYLTQAVLIIVKMRSDLESSKSWVIVAWICESYSFLFDLYMSMHFM